MAERRRAKGEDSIYPRCATRGEGHDAGDHRACEITHWVGQVVVGRYDSGLPKYRRVVRKGRGSRPKVVEALRGIRRELERGVVVDGTMTVDQYLDWWLEHVLRGRVKATTVDDYVDQLRRYARPHIGKTRMSKLSAVHIQTMLRRLADAGLAPRTRQYVLAILRTAFEWAAGPGGLLPRNWARAVDGPTGVRPRLDDLTAGEAQAVLRKVAEPQHRRRQLLAHLVLHMALRRGEACALERPHIDLDAGVLKITGTLKRPVGAAPPDRRIFLSTPKTEASEDELPIPEPLIPIFRRHFAALAEDRLAAGELWIERPVLWCLDHDNNWTQREVDLVFRMGDGRPHRPDTALVWWRNLTKAAGIGPRRMQAGRHTVATLLRDAGVRMEDISAILRHADPSITARVYARATNTTKRRGLDVMSQLLDEPPIEESGGT